MKGRWTLWNLKWQRTESEIYEEVIMKRKLCGGTEGFREMKEMRFFHSLFLFQFDLFPIYIFFLISLRIGAASILFLILDRP